MWCTVHNSPLNVYHYFYLGSMRLFSDVWSENPAFFKRLMKTKLNKLYLINLRLRLIPVVS